MPARCILVAGGYSGMIVAGLLAAISLLFGPLVIDEFPADRAHSSVYASASVDAGLHDADARLSELRMLALPFGFGLLLLLCGACIRPEDSRRTRVSLALIQGWWESESLHFSLMVPRPPGMGSRRFVDDAALN